MKKININVIGLGFVGLTTALAFSKLKYKVNAIERNKKRIKDANELIKRADDFLEKFNRKKTTSKYESVDSYETGGEVRGTGLSIKRTFKVY